MQRASRLFEGIPEAPADRVRHTDVSNHAGVEEALLARERPIHELVHDHERARREVLAERPDSRERNDVGHTGALEGVDVGAVVDRRRGEAMPPAVPREEDRAHSLDRSGDQTVGRLPERRRRVDPPRIGEPLDLVEAGAANDADDRLRVLRLHLRHYATPPASRTLAERYRESMSGVQRRRPRLAAGPSVEPPGRVSPGGARGLTGARCSLGRAPTHRPAA